MGAEKVIGEPLAILLVEDNPDHAELIIRCLQEHRLASVIHQVSDGEAALDYLFRRGAYADPKNSPRPHLVLLDLRLPKIDGQEVLKQIKVSEELRKTPVVVLTTSAAEKDVAESYHNHVNSYLVKPLDPSQFRQLMDDVGYYWMGWNRCTWHWRPR